MRQKNGRTTLVNMIQIIVIYLNSKKDGNITKILGFICTFNIADNGKKLFYVYAQHRNLNKRIVDFYSPVRNNIRLNLMENGCFQKIAFFLANRNITIIILLTLY